MGFSQRLFASAKKETKGSTIQDLPYKLELRAFVEDL
jgi:hypothetical protein